MEEKLYKITLADGTEISDLKLNGDNFISSVEITDDIFSDNCTPVIISDGKNEMLHPNMELVQITIMGNEYWIVLKDITLEELEKIKMQSDIEYIAMMSGIEL